MVLEEFASLLNNSPDEDRCFFLRCYRNPIPEEWKSSKKVQPWHIAQLGVYFILIEDHYGVRPPHGFIVLGDGRRERIENTWELRERVLAVAAEIRAHRRRLEEEIRVSPARWQCQVCGQRSHCHGTARGEVLA